MKVCVVPGRDSEDDFVEIRRDEVPKPPSFELRHSFGT